MQNGPLRILAPFGGAALFGQELGNIEVLAALKERGADVLCLVRDEDWSTVVPPALDARGLSWTKIPYIEHFRPERLHYVLLRNPIVFLKANWRFLKIVRTFRPTHIHIANHLFFLNFLIALVLTRIPMIYRAGDEPALHRWFWRALWRVVTWRVDRFVTNSLFMAEVLQASGVEQQRVIVIHNAPPRRPPAKDVVPLLPFRANDRVILFIGQVNEHKGVHLLVEAFKTIMTQYPDAHLAIAGRISDWIGDAWARDLRQEALSDVEAQGRISFLGYIEDVPALLGRSEVLVVPSLFDDPAPNVVMEAKFAQKPAIVFPRGGLPELIEHGVDGIACAEASTSALIDALRVYLDNPELAPRHGKAALASLQTLGVTEFGDRWVKAYLATSESGNLVTLNNSRAAST